MPRTVKILIAVSAVIVVAFIIAYLTLRLSEPRLRAEIIEAIELRFDADAELQDLEISLLPIAHITGNKLVLWYKGRRDLPPLIQVERFSADAEITGLFRAPRRIGQVVLKGLVITIPPNEQDDVESTQEPGAKKLPAIQKPKRVDVEPPKIPPFVIARINADGSVLKIVPKNPDKDPLIFEMNKLTLHSVGIDHAMEYESTLKNAKPPGMISARGEFGPWNKSDPGKTPVSGIYSFRNADLSIFKGISGKLSSQGKFRGVINRIDVNGTTDIPDFTLRTSGRPVQMKTEFKAVVDGTSGDTLLQPVTAHLKKTTFVCKGGVIKQKGLQGKTVLLDIQMDEGRIEDLLELAVPGRPMMIGEIQFTAKFELPPGDVDVLQKLKLNGNFGVDDAQFTTSTVQEKIETLSMRSRGKHEDDQDERIVSDLKGRFVLQKGVMHFSNLSFVVPGAQVQLEGSYELARGQMDFQGTLRMQAKLSETQKGVKSLLLKVVDPFFRKDKKTVLPITITGTRKEPKFGLRLRGGKKNN